MTDNRAHQALLDAEMEIEKHKQDLMALKQQLTRLSHCVSPVNAEVEAGLTALRHQVKNNETVLLLAKHIDAIAAALTRFENNESKSLRPEQEGLEDNQAHSPAQQVMASSSGATLFCEPNFNESVTALLEVIIVPDELKAARQQLVKTLKSKIALSQVEGIIAQLSSLIIEAHQREQDRFQDFLENLNLRFLDINSHLQQSIGQSEGRLNSSFQLKEQVATDIKQMQSQYQGSNNLEQVILLFDDGLNKISQNIEQYHQDEQDKHQQAEQEISQLKQSLADTQLKAIDLQASLLQISEQSKKDSLTGVFNRDAYDAQLDNFFHRARLLEKNVVIAIADLDHFKLINDTHGHLAGDDVLKSTAEFIQANVRENDFVARYGGEEFVIILNDIKLDDAAKVLEKIRAQISNHAFVLKQQTVQITLSIGFTVITEHDSKSSAFERADKALYQAKTAGRNQICQY